MAIYLVLLTTLAVLLALGAGPAVALIARGFDPVKREQTRGFVVLLAPFVVLDGAAGMFTATLYARKRNASAALVSAIPPLVTLLAVVFLASTWGVGVLVLGALVGAAAESIVSGALVARLGMAVVPAMTRPGPEDLELLRGFGLLLVGGILMSANTVVDQAMASGAGPGSVASLGYGAKIPAAFLGLAGAALGTVTLPHYANFVASRRFAEMGASLRKHAVTLALAGFGIALALAVLSRPLITLLFEHGSFLPADTARVAAIQAFYAFQIPGYIAGIAAARFLNALGRDRWILAVSAVNFLLNVAGNWLFLRWIGVPGIALSTAVVYTVAATLLLLLCRRAIRQESPRTQTP